MVQVYVHINLPLLTERLQVDDTDGAVIIGYPITTTVGHIQFPVFYGHLLGLPAHVHRIHFLQRQRIHFVDRAHLKVFGVKQRTVERADIGIAVMEGQRTTVGDVHLTNALAVGCRCHLHFIRHIDDHPQPTAIDGNIVSYIAQFLDGIRVAL